MVHWYCNVMRVVPKGITTRLCDAEVTDRDKFAVHYRADIR